MRIEYSSKAVKYINALDKSTKERLHKAIEKYLLGILRGCKALKMVIDCV